MFYCDGCGDWFEGEPWQVIVIQLVDTEEEVVFCFCSRNCRRAFARRLRKRMAKVGFDLELKKASDYRLRRRERKA